MVGAQWTCDSSSAADPTLRSRSGTHPAKFPDGIGPFADYVRSKGLIYGTWFEPEWAHHTSEMYRQHPDWLWPLPATGGRQERAFNTTTHTDIVRVLKHGLNTVLPGNYANTNLCQNRHDFTDYDYLSDGAGGLG